MSLVQEKNNLPRGEKACCCQPVFRMRGFPGMLGGVLGKSSLPRQLMALSFNVEDEFG